MRIQFLLGADILLTVTMEETVAGAIPASCPVDDGLFFKVKEAGA